MRNLIVFKKIKYFIISGVICFSGCINKANYFPSLEIAKTTGCLMDSYKTTKPYMFANNSETFIAEIFAGPLGMMISGAKQLWHTTALTLGLVAFELNDHWINRCSNKVISSIPENKNVLVLNVKENFMLKDDIQDGDLIIVEKRRKAKNGEMVLALLNNEDPTLNRFYLEKNQIRLQPVNSKNEPTIVDKTNLKIQGVVVGVMRPFHQN